MTAKIEAWKEPKEERDKFEAWYVCHIGDLSQYPIGSRECYLQWNAWKAAIISAHAPKQEPVTHHPGVIETQELQNTYIKEASVPGSKLKEFERELQWGSSIKRLRRLFTDIIHEAEQEKQP